MQIDGARSGTPWRQAGPEIVSAGGSRYEGESGGDAFSGASPARTWRSMTGLFILQFALLILALLLAARVLRAEPQNQIAAVVGDDGRVVYINADDPPAPVVDGLFGSGKLAPVVPPHIRQLIGENASRFNVDPKLVDAVVHVESGYDAHALSPKGAQGLMQLIPATAARFGVQNPFDPAENVRGGVSYLSQLLKQFDGSVPLTLAAYNAGEGAVQRYGGIPPYSETQAYVRKVTGIYPAGGIATPDRPMAGVHLPKAPLTGNPRPDNAACAAPIYEYVDERGVTHFAQ